jgi:hypothetical protein
MTYSVNHATSRPEPISVLANIRWLGLDGISAPGFALYKATLGTVLGLFITPLVAVLAMTCPDTPRIATAIAE